MIEAIKLPEIGENVESGIVVAVHVKEGDRIAVDDTVIELETDKALVEIPSPFNGRITEVLAEAGAQMNVGDVIARVETESRAAPDEPDRPPQSAETEEGAGKAGPPDEPPERPTADEKRSVPATPAKAASATQESSEHRPPPAAAPSIRRLARELGVDIYRVEGTGPAGRISEADVKNHVRRSLPERSNAPDAIPAQQTVELPDFSRWGDVDMEKMDTVRRLTANSTAASWATVPHVTQFDEADISDVAAFIDKKGKAAANDGTKITITAVIARICASALQRFPQFNASVDIANQRIVYKRDVHIGIAADTPRGLLVPVIRNADRKGILALADAIADLAKRARSKKIKPDEMEGGTFTISNQGGIGGVGFTPIVLWPQVAILGISRSAVKPVWDGEAFVPRTMLPLSLSYDHRIIDGADAARFLRWICEGLERPLNLFLD
ncbi:2-oxo acid dehydrogenase subunit E2 [uncultured Desulfosarcina sp.]|uniref:2-oxo acid dehydrogenase subunit E2 n=1 Tax=uncultured Desulfosarcina sp. TaxID=218289 RepID=UPI0029C802C0|nr:2-oxo acid dehydrogenase subunit E2 [uncultured Desulfosarcina sp.]